VGPLCQLLLPPLNCTEEREENEIERYRPSQGRFSSPNERRRKGDENEPFKRENGATRREYWLSVPISFL